MGKEHVGHGVDEPGSRRFGHSSVQRRMQLVFWTVLRSSHG